jgi:hypothetical protein
VGGIVLVLIGIPDAAFQGIPDALQDRRHALATLLGRIAMEPMADARLGVVHGAILMTGLGIDRLVPVEGVAPVLVAGLCRHAGWCIGPRDAGGQMVQFQPFGEAQGIGGLQPADGGRATALVRARFFAMGKAGGAIGGGEGLDEGGLPVVGEA